MTDNLFGPIVTPLDVENAVTATFVKWMPSYLAELERRTDRDAGVLPAPKSWATVGPELEKPSNSVGWPAGIVLSSGTLETPQRRGDGLYDVWFDIRVAVLVQGVSRQNASELAKLYATAAWLAVMQHPKPEGLAGRMVWAGAVFSNLPANIRFGAGTEIALEVLAEEIGTAFGGPTTPDLDPAELPEVETANIDVQRRSLT